MFLFKSGCDSASSVVFWQLLCPWNGIQGIYFSASRDKFVKGTNVIALASMSVLAAWTKTLTMAITFKPEVIGLSYCARVFLVTRPFIWYHNFYLLTLTLKSDLLLKNFNLFRCLVIVAALWAMLSSDNSYMSSLRDRYFIFGIYTLLIKPFQRTPGSMTLWPWPLILL